MLPAPSATIPPPPLSSARRSRRFPDLAEKITTLIATRDFPLNRELVAKVPPSLLQLLMLPGFDPKRVKLLADSFGVHDRASLRHASGPTMTGDRMLCPREGRL